MHPALTRFSADECQQLRGRMWSPAEQPPSVSSLHPTFSLDWEETHPVLSQSFRPSLQYASTSSVPAPRGWKAHASYNSRLTELPALSTGSINLSLILLTNWFSDRPAKGFPGAPPTLEGLAFLTSFTPCCPAVSPPRGRPHFFTFPYLHPLLSSPKFFSSPGPCVGEAGSVGSSCYLPACSGGLPSPRLGLLPVPPGRSVSPASPCEDLRLRQFSVFIQMPHSTRHVVRAPETHIHSPKPMRLHTNAQPLQGQALASPCARPSRRRPPLLFSGATCSLSLGVLTAISVLTPLFLLPPPVTQPAHIWWGLGVTWKPFFPYIRAAVTKASPCIPYSILPLTSALTIPWRVRSPRKPLTFWPYQASGKRVAPQGPSLLGFMVHRPFLTLLSPLQLSLLISETGPPLDENWAPSSTLRPADFSSEHLTGPTPSPCLCQWRQCRAHSGCAMIMDSVLRLCVCERHALAHVCWAPSLNLCHV